MSYRVACVGAGVIGRSWAVRFALGGAEVTIHDSAPGIADQVLRLVEQALATFERAGAISSAAEVMRRVRFEPVFGQAVADIDYVQESVREDVGGKRAVFEQLNAALPPQALAGSSTSTIAGSEFMLGLPASPRFIVAHPINPPHVLPLVELCPTPATAEDTYARTERLMTDVGQVPIRVSAEVRGFVLNRLQNAVIGEALHLVSEGVCTPADVDKCLKYGLALRWSFLGPFETGHLNSDGGYRKYMADYGGVIHATARDLKVDYRASDETIAAIDAYCRESLPAGSIGDLQAWRDDVLLRLGLFLGATVPNRVAPDSEARTA